MSDQPAGTHTASGPSTPIRVGGRYVLRGVLGRGGMATVHRARDEVLDRDVAVKLLHAHLATDPAFLDRFRREARAAAALSHPNVVAVHDWGETEDGPFLVLQLIEGPSLRAVLRHRRRLHPEEVVTVLGPAAAGLAAAHAAGLVHRDVKPENLLLGLDGTVRVTDFGLARAAASATSTFGTDVLVGSPHYLSPEAVRGEPLDPRADVYALGVVLYESLTGRPPFEADTPFATAVQHTSQRVPAPSALAPEVPTALDEVVRRATDPDRDRRYPDAAAFAAALTAAAPASSAPLPALFADDTGIDLDGRTGTAVLGPEAHDTTVSGAEPPPPPAPLDDGSSVAWDADGAQLWPPPLPPSGDRDDGDRDDGDRDDDPVAWLGDLTGDPDADVTAPPDEDDAEEVRGRPRRRWLVALLVIAGALVASALGGYLVWDRVLAPVVAVPAVTGAPVDSAVGALEDAGLEVAVDDERRNDLEVPAGHVLSQDPPGETEVRQGRTVTLVVSAGPRQIAVPDVAEITPEEAEELLVGADLTLGEITETHHEEVPEGQVIASEPAAAEVVDETSPIDLVVSRGPAPREVPELTGSTLEEAQATLRELGLDAEVAGREYADAPAGTIIGQTPGAGDQVARGSSVTVTISDGPAPIEVPNVRGQVRSEAVATLEGLGFVVEVETRGGVGAFFNPGRVFEQDPGPGSERFPGDTVLLYAYED
ncbi:MAG: Stk1 family PASTA domain-containing Ser/Thr kinase [Nitriliruptor sp.]